MKPLDEFWGVRREVWRWTALLVGLTLSAGIARSLGTAERKQRTQARTSAPAVPRSHTNGTAFVRLHRNTLPPARFVETSRIEIPPVPDRKEIEQLVGQLYSRTPEERARAALQLVW